MAKQERLQQLESLIKRVRRSQTVTPGEAATIQRELIGLAKRCWPEDEDDDEEENDAETQSFERLEEVLLKLPAGDQEAVVAAFRPLRACVSRRLAEWTNALNDWLSEAGQVQAQHLGDLLREVDSSPQSRWYRQCPKPRVKAKFLMAIASLARALIRGSPLVKPLIASHPAVLSLAKKIVSRLFVLPGYGDSLERWHDGRLAVYNATISLAAQRAADKLKDDLQVSLVSAVKRSANPASTEDGKAKVALQLQLRDWPMSGCPLARALLEFLKSRAAELGDLGRPSLRECPPHALQPETLRKLLSRLDAFEMGGTDGIVRLRFEAVAALAFKAVGTKPKASTVAPPTATKSQMAAAQLAQGPPVAQAAKTNHEGLPQDMSDLKIDFSDVTLMIRIIKRGLRSGDEEWRQAWSQFCWKRDLRSKLSVRNKISPPKEALAAFLEANLPKLRSSLWDPSLASRSRSDMAERRRRREPRELSESWSSSCSESERSRRRKKRRKEKKSGLMGYADFFNSKSKHMTPEVMMMRAQMMGFSMVMDNPLAMMGMRTPMMTPSMTPMLPRPEAPPGRPYGHGGHSQPMAPLPPPPLQPTTAPAPAVPAPSTAPPAPVPTNNKPPLPKSVVAAARKQQESTIDMDDL